MGVAVVVHSNAGLWVDKRVLVTGFDPFGGASENPSQTVAMRFHEQVIRHHDFRIEVLGHTIPTVFQQSAAVLSALIARLEPDVVVCVGQAGGRSQVTPERIALNLDDARIPDNQGNQPVDAAIVPDGPAGYWSTLPIKRIVHNLRVQGIPAAVSNSAGTFVCNHLFYHLMHLLHTEYTHIRGGFVHVPFLPQQTLDSAAPSLDLETIVRALAVVIQTSVETGPDMVMADGQEA